MVQFGYSPIDSVLDRHEFYDVIKRDQGLSVIEGAGRERGKRGGGGAGNLNSDFVQGVKSSSKTAAKNQGNFTDRQHCGKTNKPSACFHCIL